MTPFSSIPILSGDEHVERFRKAVGEDRFPGMCQWEITCRCNFKCVMCYTDCFNAPEHISRELSTAEIFRIMDQMREAGVLEITFTGGEPMSRSDFREIYLRAVQNGFVVTVFTNGSLIDESWTRLWKEYPPFMVEISHHGASEATFERVTAVRGSFARVRRSIEMLLAAGIPLTVKATGMTVNSSELLEIKAYVRSKNLRFRLGPTIRPSANGDTAVQDYQLSPVEIQEIVDRDPELVLDSERTAREETRKSSFCHEGKQRFHIDAYGRLQLCSNNRRNAYDLRSGNFDEGFYQHLPKFYCPYKKSESELYEITRDAASHAGI